MSGDGDFLSCSSFSPTRIDRHRLKRRIPINTPSIARTRTLNLHSSNPRRRRKPRSPNLRRPASRITSTTTSARYPPQPLVSPPPYQHPQRRTPLFHQRPAIPLRKVRSLDVSHTPARRSLLGNGVAAEQHLLNAKLALRKQLEQTLLQIPTPKPSTCDLTFIPGLNGWSEFLAYLGLEQALNTYTDIVNRRPPSEISMNLPHVCAQCGTDWSVTWHEMSSGSDTSTDEKILCDRCTKTSQKKLLKQDHSNRLRQAFIKALQQEKELDAKFQQSSSSTTTSTVTSTTATSAPATAVKQSSSHHHHQQVPSKHAHTANKHSSKPLSTKTSSNHNHHHNSSTNNNNNSSNNNNNNHHSHHHHHHHSSKSSSSSSKSHHANASALASLNPTSAESLASTLAALQSSEHMDFFQKHFLSNMLPFAVANQAAAAYAAKSSQQQQALAALPAMAASLMRQPNPAQYLLDMIPQATKQQQQQHHHHHSK